jgi:hypothetical protein
MIVTMRREPLWKRTSQVQLVSRSNERCTWGPDTYVDKSLELEERRKSEPLYWVRLRLKDSPS